MKVAHRNDRTQIQRVLSESEQALLPMLQLIEGAQASIDELMHETVIARAEQLLVLSAQELAGTKQRGREAGAVLRHGSQRGVVALEAQKSFRKIQGVNDLWIRRAALGRGIEQAHVDEPMKARVTVLRTVAGCSYGWDIT